MIVRRRARGRSAGRRRASSGRPVIGRWLLLAAAGVALLVAGFYLGQTGAPPDPEAPGEPPTEAAARAPDRGERPAADPPARPEATYGDEPRDAVDTDAEGAGARELTTLQPALPGDGAAVALVIDDLGRSLADVERIRALGVPVTYAVLPFESRTAEVAAALRSGRDEMLVHLPMEAAGGADPGPGALTVGMTTAELASSTRRALDAVEGAVGVNNHMGSMLSADRSAMGAILGVIAERGLYFLDSRTSPRSVGFATARALDLPAAERQVFLDPDPRREAVRAEFRRLLALARERGAAVAIGHPHPDTLAVLEEEVPLARELGYRFVPVSYLLERTAVAAK